VGVLDGTKWITDPDDVPWLTAIKVKPKKGSLLVSVQANLWAWCKGNIIGFQPIDGSSTLFAHTCFLLAMHVADGGKD
jgi:hypothetical protein